jgi:RNA polymerase sigma-70 factor (ECF subfamily)
MTIFQQDRALLDAFRKGRSKALSTVYFEYVNDIEALIKSGFTEKNSGVFISGVRDLELVRELLQEVFLRAFSERARLAYDGIRPYSSYLSTIARNTLIDAWRSDSRNPLSARRRELGEESLDVRLQKHLDSHREKESLDEQIHWQRCLEASDEYVAGLDRISKEFVRLRFQKELPQRDVAGKLKLTRWKVRVLEKRIQSNLRKHLIRQGLVKK